MATGSIHHWAGIASLHLKAGEKLPGFAQIIIEAAEDRLTAWDGQFFAGVAIPELHRATSAELVLPGDGVAHATVAANAGGVFSISGQEQWPGWEELLKNAEEPPAPEFFVRDGFVEVRAAPVISPANWVPADSFPIRQGQRMLVDYRPVTQIFVPFTSFLDAAETLQRLGARVAVVASSGLAFGISRQAILTAGLDEEHSFRVFWDYDEALVWLLADR
ncbi:MAG: hypothetical protein AB7J35_20395 [Dehalococcoidia bacterium]